MDWFDDKSPAPGGGRASSGGRFYHMSFRSGSRGNGACARASHDYITREGEYADGDRDSAIYTESDQMPSWAEDDARNYWDAADLYERANGRLYVSADFALPRDLSTDDQVALAREFARELTRDERLPYTLAIHSGRDADGNEHNPHAHLMISERKNDGIDRSPQQWFSRANSTDPSRGGAEKTRAIHGHAWIEHARSRWAELTNKTMQRLGRDERVDHRSYERRGTDQEPGRHYGPSAAYIASRGETHDRLEVAAGVVSDQERLNAVDSAIASLETERQALISEDQKRSEWEWASHGDGHVGGSSRDHDESRSR
jgi:MobA/MobL family protein